MNRGRVERDPKLPTYAPPSFGSREDLDATAPANAGVVHFWGNSGTQRTGEAGAARFQQHPRRQQGGLPLSIPSR